MLVLSRKVNEVIQIGDNIEVQILQIKGSIVRLGITAPRDISVVRPRISKHETTAVTDLGDTTNCDPAQPPSQQLTSQKFDESARQSPKRPRIQKPLQRNREIDQMTIQRSGAEPNGSVSEM